MEIAGQNIPINTNFRTGILFEEMLKDKDYSDVDKIATLLELYYPDITFSDECLAEAITQAIWFYRCGADEKETPKVQNTGSPPEPSFSYEYDADYIYAAFMASYKIDLAIEKLHWWQFQALFRALPDDTQIMKIISYRTMKISPKLSKEQKEHYRKLKELYALPQDKEQADLESDLTELLMNGGNASRLLNEENCNGRRNP